MKKLLALTILCLSMTAFAEEATSENKEDVINLKNSKHEEGQTEAGTLATGHDSDCVSCKASQEVNGTLTNYPQSPKAETPASASAPAKTETKKGRK